AVKGILHHVLFVRGSRTRAAQHLSRQSHQPAIVTLPQRLRSIPITQLQCGNPTSNRSKERHGFPNTTRVTSRVIILGSASNRTICFSARHRIVGKENLLNRRQVAVPCSQSRADRSNPWGCGTEATFSDGS